MDKELLTKQIQMLAEVIEYNGELTSAMDSEIETLERTRYNLRKASRESEAKSVQYRIGAIDSHRFLVGCVNKWCSDEIEMLSEILRKQTN